jgi:hypothetical protein
MGRGVGWHRTSWFPGEKNPGLPCMIGQTKGVGSLQGLCGQSGFSYADSAFQAAVTTCLLERGPQKNVRCLEMTSSPSLAGGGDGC